MKTVKHILLSGVSLLIAAAWPALAETAINVPSSEHTRHFDMGVIQGEGGLIQIHAKRVGKLGVSHAVRLVNCENRKFKFLYDEELPPETFPLPVSTDGMYKILSQSESWWVSNHACAKLGYTWGE